MARALGDGIDNWDGGVVTAGDSHGGHKNTALRGWNSVLKTVGLTKAYPAKRPGAKTVNQNNGQVSANPITHQYQYKIVADGSFTHNHLLAVNGEIYAIDSDTNGSGAVTLNQTSFIGALDTDNLSFVTAKNLCFLVETSATKYKLHGSAFAVPWGIVRPSTAPSGAAGAAGVMTGTFEVRITFRNTDTGHESSAGPTMTGVALTAQQLSLTSVPTSSDSQVTQRRIWIRNTNSQTEFRLADTIDDNTTTTATLNLDTSILVTRGPNTTENDPPVEGVRFAAWVNSYMFVADEERLYWSKKDKPEAFDSTFAGEPVGAGDNQRITGLYGFGDVLLIFKNKSVYYLSGTTPSTWKLRPLFTDVGAINQWSIAEAGGKLWFWSEKGPAMWDGTGQPIVIGEVLLDLEWDESTDAERVFKTRAGVCPNTKSVVWTFCSDSSQTHPDKLLAVNYEKSVFQADLWDPMKVTSMATVEDENGKKWLYFGNTNGQIFRFTDGLNDGVPGGTSSGTFTPATEDITTIAGTGFYTTGQGLAKRMVSIEDSNGLLVGRVEISSNTSTELTLAETVEDLTVGDTYSFYIGGPNFEWLTVDLDSQATFEQKRLQTVHIQAKGPTTEFGVHVFTDEDEDTPKRYLNFSQTSGNRKTVTKRLAAGAVGITHRVKFYNRAPDEDVAIYALGLKAELLTDKVG